MKSDSEMDSPVWETALNGGAGAPTAGRSDIINSYSGRSDLKHLAAATSAYPACGQAPMLSSNDCRVVHCTHRVAPNAIGYDVIRTAFRERKGMNCVFNSAGCGFGWSFHFNTPDDCQTVLNTPLITIALFAI